MVSLRLASVRWAAEVFRGLGSGKWRNGEGNGSRGFLLCRCAQEIGLWGSVPSSRRRRRGGGRRWSSGRVAERGDSSARVEGGGGGSGATRRRPAQAGGGRAGIERRRQRRFAGSQKKQGSRMEEGESGSICNFRNSRDLTVNHQ